MKRFYMWLLAFIITVNFCYAAEIEKDFFSHPEMILSKDIEEKLCTKSLDMSWQYGENFFQFVSKKDEIYFEILLDKIPKSYDEATKTRFIEETINLDGKEKKYSIFAYEWKNQKEQINQYRKLVRHRGSNTTFYLVDKRRIFEHSTPQSIQEGEIATIISNRNVLFYTGAGISIAAGVPSMSQLNDLLGIEEGEKFVFSLKHAVEHPKTLCEKILQFHHACFYSPPTAAHQALKKLALFKNTQILTENLDCLHERSGILPYRINAEELREKVGIDQLAQIDYIICIGLSYDDKGFLGWYKHYNPKGKIISIDIGNPSYLGDEDFIIHADLQFLIPSLAEKILGTKEIRSQSGNCN